MKLLNLSNRGITTPVIQERCYLIKVVKPSGEIIILRNRDRLDALEEAFTIAYRKPECKVYFVGVMTYVDYSEKYSKCFNIRDIIRR